MLSLMSLAYATEYGFLWFMLHIYGHVFFNYDVFKIDSWKNFVLFVFFVVIIVLVLYGK